MATPRGERTVRDDRRSFARMMWQTWSPPGWFDEADFQEAAVAFDDPDWVDVVLHSYRHRWGHAAGDPSFAAAEALLDPAPRLSVPTLVIHGGADDCNHPDTSSGREPYFTGRYDRRVLPGVGHFPPRRSARCRRGRDSRLLRNRLTSDPSIRECSGGDGRDATPDPSRAAPRAATPRRARSPARADSDRRARTRSYVRRRTARRTRWRTDAPMTGSSSHPSTVTRSGGIRRGGHASARTTAEEVRQQGHGRFAGQHEPLQHLQFGRRGCVDPLGPLPVQRPGVDRLEPRPLEQRMSGQVAGIDETVAEQQPADVVGPQMRVEGCEIGAERRADDQRPDNAQVSQHRVETSRDLERLPEPGQTHRDHPQPRTERPQRLREHQRIGRRTVQQHDRRPSPPVSTQVHGWPSTCSPRCG